VSWLENKTFWEDMHVTASECALYYCINAYESNVKGGVLNETVVASWADRVPGSYQDARSHGFKALDKTSNHTLDYPFGQFKLSELQLSVPPSASSSPSPIVPTPTPPPLRGSPSRSPLIRALGPFFSHGDTCPTPLNLRPSA